LVGEKAGGHARNITITGEGEDGDGGFEGVGSGGTAVEERSVED